MYKIMVKNLETGESFWEYGFTRKMMDKLYFYINEQNEETFYRVYEIVWFEKLYPTWKVFKKCLTNYKKVI